MMTSEEEALAIFESGEGFEPVPGEYTPLGRIVRAAERRGAIEALRALADVLKRDGDLWGSQVAIVRANGIEKDADPA